MKLVIVLGFVVAATIGTTQAAQAPDLSNCSAALRSLTPQKYTQVADALGNTGAVIAPQSASPSSINIYSETSADKLASATSGAVTRVYVPNHSSDTVSVIDPATHKVIDTYKAGLGPQHIVPSYDLKTLWIANTANQTDHGSLTAIDPTTGKPGKQIAVDDPYNLYFTPDGTAAIVVAEAFHRLDLRDPETMQLKSSIDTRMCDGVNHADYTADYKYLILTCEFGGVLSGMHGQEARKTDAGASLIRVDWKEGKVVDSLTFSKPGMPQDIRLSPDGKTFFVADMMNDGVFLVDADSFRETGFIATGKGAHGLNVSRDAKYLYVANRGSNRMPDKADGAGSVSVINFATLGVEHTWLIPGGGSPDMGNISLDGKELWLSGRYDGQVYAIDTESGAVTKINVGLEPHGLTFWPQPGRYSLGHTGNMR